METPSKEKNIPPKAEEQGTTATPVSPPPSPPVPPKPPTRLNVGRARETIVLPHDAAKPESGGKPSFFKRFGIGIGAGLGAIAGFRLFRRSNGPDKKTPISPIKPVTTKRRGLFGIFRRRNKRLKIKPRKPTLR